MSDTPIVHIACPKLAREALGAGSSRKAPLYDAFTAFVGSDALFTSEGPLWRAQRAGVTRALARAGTAAMEEGAAREAAAVLGHLFAASSTTDVDMQPFLLRSTFAFLTGTLLESDGADEALVGRYLAAAAVLRASLPAKTRSAAWRLLPAPMYRLCTPLGRAEGRAVRSAHALSRQALACAGPASPLAHALQLSNMGGESRGASESAALHCAATLLFAGHDTQSATLSWALLRLGEPGGGVRLQEGIRAECCGGERSRPLLDAAIKETLRLHPPAPLVMRVMPAGIECPPGLPEGGAAAVWLHSVQRDADAWGADADLFRPERWLEEDGRTPAVLSEAQAAAYMPFAAGARLCPGAQLAQAGLKAALGVLVGGMSWRIAGEAGGEGHLHPSTGFTVTPARGVRLRITKLQAAAPDGIHLK
jgi:cytochrome P450